MTVALISVESPYIFYISAHLSHSWSSTYVEKASVYTVHYCIKPGLMSDGR